MDRPGDSRVCRQPINSDEPLEGNYFVAAYPPFSTWSPKHVADVRKLLLSPPPSPAAPLGLYVHVPFCMKRCDYCYYLSYAEHTLEQRTEYVNLLIAEARMYAGSAAFKNRRPSFVYFGGGTPSLLGAELTERLLDGLRRTFSWGEVREVTFECAPRSVSDALVSRLVDGGVTRVSLGVQSFDDHILQLSGRAHLTADVERAYAAIRRGDFAVVNLDLIVGLPGETEASFLCSVDRSMELDPEMITIYELEIPYNTPLCRSMHGSGPPAPLPDWDEKRSRLMRAFAQLEGCGYQVRSAYAAVRDPVRHCFVYQDEQYRGADVLGLGVASFSYVSGVHFQNLASLDAYTGAIGAGELPVHRAYPLNKEEQFVRELVLRLKLGEVNIEHLRDKFGPDLRDCFAPLLDDLSLRGWLEVDATCVRLTREGLVRADRIVRSFYLPAHAAVRYC
ncbi:MAG: coproporphyrinogen-III oxidase family protein [Planctomycetota bacterium]|mgnify:CR=1 FL=1